MTANDLYQATILDHDRAPHNRGSLPAPTHQATIDNPLCGDVVTIQAQLLDGTLHDLVFDGQGCALSRAAASIMTSMLRGADPTTARQLAETFEQFVHSPPDAPIPDTLGDLRAFSAVRRFRSRRLCALLPFRALREALDPPRS